MRRYIPTAEMLWTPDPNVEAARRLPGWREFHRACGEASFSFDHMERENGRRSPYRCVCFEAKKNSAGFWFFYELATGRATTVLDAVADAYRKSGRATPELDRLLDRLLTGDPAEEDFTALLGGEAADADDFEGML